MKAVDVTIEADQGYVTLKVNGEIKMAMSPTSAEMLAQDMIRVAKEIQGEKYETQRFVNN